jgi:hypothetical protein
MIPVDRSSMPAALANLRAEFTSITLFEEASFEARDSYGFRFFCFLFSNIITFNTHDKIKCF